MSASRRSDVSLRRNVSGVAFGSGLPVDKAEQISGFVIAALEIARQVRRSTKSQLATAEINWFGAGRVILQFFKIGPRSFVEKQ